MAGRDDDIFDEEWLGVEPSRSRRPIIGERTRAAIVLALIFVALFAAASAMSPGGGESRAESRRTSTTTTVPSTVTTTTTTAPPAPDSIDGAPPSPRCAGDDRGALPLRSPQESTVVVLNGTPRTGHAGANTSRLASLGYTTAEPGNASIRSTTIVRYRRGFCAEAEQLAADLAIGSEIEIELAPDDDPALLGLANLVALLGRDSL